MERTEPGRLSEMELEVMRVVWGMASPGRMGEQDAKRPTSPVTVARVLEVFSARRGWKTSTLSTIMDRLIEKGYLSKTRDGKANCYTCLITEAAHKERETRAFLAEVHNGSVKNFIAALADGKGISAEELAEVRAWFRAQAGEP